MHVKFHGSTPSLRWFLGKKTPKTAILGTFFWDIRTRTWYWVKQAWISIPQGNAHISRPNMIGATGLAFLTPLSFELEILIPQTGWTSIFFFLVFDGFMKNRWPKCRVFQGASILFLRDQNGQTVQKLWPLKDRWARKKSVKIWKISFLFTIFGTWSAPI